MNRDEIMATIKAKLATALEQAKSPRVRAVESGQIEVEYITQRDMILGQITDENQKKEAESILLHPDILNAFLDYLASLITFKYIDAGQQVVPNKIRVMKFKQYKLSKMGMLLQCIPIIDDCPKSPKDLIAEIIRNYGDREDVIETIVNAVIDVAKNNENVLKMIAEKINGVQTSGSN